MNIKQTTLLLLILISSFCVHAQTKEQTLLITKTKAFYDWYKKNAEHFNNFDLYKSKNNDGDGPYYIDWKAVNKYFTYIRTSVKFLGETFIANQKKEFENLDKFYKENPDEAIPAGFDYERIVGGQVGVEEALQYLFPKGGKWVVVIKGNTATAAYVFTSTNYDSDMPKDSKSITEFKKEKGVWKISKTVAMTEMDTINQEILTENTITL